MQKVLQLLVLSILITSCAQIGNPGGGPKDIYPPKFLKSEPDTLATRISTQLKQITLNFDEYVVVKDASKQVIISPPTQVFPTIEPSVTAKRYVTVKFYEPLLENTTYIINFGSAIQDNNEGNKLNNFSYIFSTGDKIDSLSIKGSINQSLEKKELKSGLVSLYQIYKDKEGKDSINIKAKPYYVTRIDSLGNFELKHLHQGKFRLIAFDDLNANLMPDIDKELVGFSTEEVDPAEPLPSYTVNLTPVKQKYKAQKAEQEGQGIIKFTFKGNPKDINIKPLESDFPSIQTIHKPFVDSLYVYFNTNQLKEKKKTRFKFLVENNEKKDTLSLLYDNSLETKLSISPEEKELTPFTFVTLKSNNYITSLDKSKIEVYKNREPLEFTAVIDSLNPKNVNIKFPINYDTNYEVKAQVGAFTDFLEQQNSDSIEYSIRTKSIREYGNFRLTLQNKPSTPFFLELLDEKYQVIKSIYGSQDVFEFKGLNPGKYIIRILVDENSNGVWDPADLETLTPAEKTYIYPKPIEVRAFWDINELWIL